MPEDWSTAPSPFSPILALSDRDISAELETVMSNFQRLLESPLHWAAGVAGTFFKRPRTSDRRRRERILRRDFLNG